MLSSEVVVDAVYNRFSAAGSAIGYLAQIEYALLIALQRMDQEDSEALRISLEMFDDIAFEGTKDSRELWQTKHHVNRRGALNDTSPDLWKSIGNWIEISDERSECILFTNVKTPNSTATRLLRQGRSDDDIAAARDKLDNVANQQQNKSLKSYHLKYLDLSPDERTRLLSRVTVVDGQVSGTDISNALLSTLRKAIGERKRVPLMERLRGWWCGRTMEHLNRIARKESDWITMQEIEGRLHRIAQSLRDENLPLDYNAEPRPAQDEVDKDDRIFVQQLQLVMLHRARIRDAVYDHNRAFLQRSQWLREQLLINEDLNDYDQRLIEEWRRVFLPLAEDDDDSEASEETKIKSARERYGVLQLHALPELRSEMSKSYVSIGSLHMLSDKLKIGWHPDWRERFG